MSTTATFNISNISTNSANIFVYPDVQYSAYRIFIKEADTNITIRDKWYTNISYQFSHYESGLKENTSYVVNVGYANQPGSGVIDWIGAQTFTTGGSGGSTTYKATVYFNANGGYGEPSSVYGTTTNSDRYCVVNIPNIRPIRDGYDFQGWALSSSLNPPSYQPGGTITLYGNAISSSSDIGASYTLYAIWKESVSGGYVYISNGSVFNKYEVWIYTNSWKRCTPYIYTNAWNNC